jgi:hypothetical protein
MVRTWGRSGPIEMVGRKMAFFRDTTICQQKFGGTARKEGFNPEGGGSAPLKNADIRLQYYTDLTQKI